MSFFELEPSDISNLSDANLREMVARLCEAELISQQIRPSCVSWGGAQEAADGGLDIRVTDATPLSNPIFILRENTGFQIKKNSMSKAACKNEMLSEGNLKSVIADLLNKKGAYIIISGRDDCSDKMLSERVEGMKSAVEGLLNQEDLLLDFYGRDRLCSWLRQFPGVALWVRSRLGKPLSGWSPFGRWAGTPANSDDDFLLDEHPCVIDKNSYQKKPLTITEGIILVREKLRKAGFVVRIIGLSGVGKTRFAQALFEDEVCNNPLPKANVIYADLGNNLSPTASELISYLIANDFSSCVVLDNCPPDTHRTLQKQISSSQASLSLLTIEYDISDDRPEETEVIHIEPSSEEVISKLIQKRFPSVGQVNANIIAEFSGGNARVAIALASQVDAEETLTNFSDEDLFQRLFNQRKGVNDNLLESAESLSLVYSFNVSAQESNDELSALSRISGLERQKLYRHHNELVQRQLVQKRGDWRAVLPHALANRLAKRALSNIELDKINAELLKKENFRLFKSCAHRLGYLHDFELAQNLGRSWMQTGGPFDDIERCGEERLTALSYIAPLFPDMVLTAIDDASKSLNFCSRNNQNFFIIIWLLRKIAYDDEYFDRAAGLILRFAETERVGENNNSIINQLKDLFSLYLSGTQATPQRRISFLNNILISDTSKKLEIAQEIFNAAFKVCGFISTNDFTFGARIRDYGWEPKTYEEKMDWYSGFLALLVPFLDSKDDSKIEWAKGILTGNFVNLWDYGGCCEIIEEIIQKHASGGKWPAMWIAIKNTINYYGDQCTPEQLEQLNNLERLTAPANLYSEIEAYALTDIWSHMEPEDENKDWDKKLIEKIENLGVQAASEPTYIERLASKLWVNDVNALYAFGKGLAKGSTNQKLMLDTLIDLMQQQKLEVVQPRLFCGFIEGVHENNTHLSRELQEKILSVPELKRHSITILLVTPITPWKIKKFIELAKNAELEADNFKQLAYGRQHESIDDDNLLKLLVALNDLEDGISASIEILSMRFYSEQYSDYCASDELRALGRQTVLKLVSMRHDEIDQIRAHSVDSIINKCLLPPAPENEIRIIIDLICEGVETSRLRTFKLENIINFLVENYPEYFLDRLFQDDKNSERLIRAFVKNKINQINLLFNLASAKRILNWCNGDQDKIQKVANTVSAYTSLSVNNQTLGHPTSVTLSQHILLLLDAAENKVAIVETIYSNIIPRSCSGSIADILVIRSSAFAKLLEYDTPEVREIVKEKLSQLNRLIKEERDNEAKFFNSHEQKFE